MFVSRLEMYCIRYMFICLLHLIHRNLLNRTTTVDVVIRLVCTSNTCDDVWIKRILIRITIIRSERYTKSLVHTSVIVNNFLLVTDVIEQLRRERVIFSFHARNDVMSYPFKSPTRTASRPITFRDCVIWKCNPVYMAVRR